MKPPAKPRGKPGLRFIDILGANFANLFKVKTIITLCIVFTFCYLTIKGEFDGKDFLIIATAVITYYFTKESNDKGKGDQNG
jgi:hypothetical protein